MTDLHYSGHKIDLIELHIIDNTIAKNPFLDYTLSRQTDRIAQLCISTDNIMNKWILDKNHLANAAVRNITFCKMASRSLNPNHLCFSVCVCVQVSAYITEYRVSSSCHAITGLGAFSTAFHHRTLCMCVGVEWS